MFTDVHTPPHRTRDAILPDNARRPATPAPPTSSKTLPQEAQHETTKPQPSHHLHPGRPGTGDFRRLPGQRQPGPPEKFADIMSLVTTLFLRLIKMIIAPLVFSTLVVGIAKMGDA